MRKIREVLRLRHEAGLSFEAIAAALKLSKGGVAKYLGLATKAGLAWPLPLELDDAALEARLFPPVSKGRAGFVEPDCAWVHQELKKKGVTLTLLWEEYRLDCAGRAFRYSAFCIRYRQWVERLKRSMRQVHAAGEKLFIDYAGPTVPIIDAGTGEVRRASIFVAALGASNYTFACATWRQSQADWLTALAQALSFIGGVSALIVPDNARALIRDANRYEPQLNRTVMEFAAHYGTAILPARPAHPRDKAKVEVAVQVVERWILARLRHRRFFSLPELNAAIAQLLEELNRRPFKRLPGSRREAFEALDRPALKALPAAPFEYAEWKKVRVNIDYHVEIDGHFYSVPHALARAELEARISAHGIECFHRGKRVAVHARSAKRGAHTTLDEHMPASHRAHAGWTPGKLLNWALAVGTATRDLVKQLLESKSHPEQGYRACLGLMRLAREYGAPRLEAACARALAAGAPRYRSVASILKAGLDRQGRHEEPAELHLPAHANVRGPTYYH